MTIRKEGGVFKVISQTGTVLGTHETESKAQAQESAILISKKKGKKKK